FGVGTVAEIRQLPQRLAGLSEPLLVENARLKHFLKGNLYRHPVITEDRDQSVECLARLFHFYLGARDSMPPDHEERALTDPRYVVVCDYIAGMTDHFLLKQYREHFEAPPLPTSTAA